jgi:tetratricopeptide (TPR) repeat protein
MKNTICGLMVALLFTASLFGDDAVKYINSGNAKVQSRDWDGAIADFSQAIAINTNEPNAWLNRARAKQANHDPAGALADLNETIALSPDQAYAYVLRGTLKQDLGYFADALTDYDFAIDKLHYNTFDFAYYNRANARAALGNLSGAVADYGQALTLNSQNFNAWLCRANLQQELGDFAFARADYDQAIKLNPDYGPIYFNRGCLHYNLGEFAAALTDFRKVCEVSPADYGDYGHFRIWLTRARLGETDAATAELNDYWNKRALAAAGWPDQVAHFLTGQLPEPDFLKAAADSNHDTDAGQHCEAYFYAGAKRLLAGDKPRARDYFQKCQATGIKQYCEYQSAVAELKN